LGSGVAVDMGSGFDSGVGSGAGSGAGSGVGSGAGSGSAVGGGGAIKVPIISATGELTWVGWDADSLRNKACNTTPCSPRTRLNSRMRLSHEKRGDGNGSANACE